MRTRPVYLLLAALTPLSVSAQVAPADVLMAAADRYGSVTTVCAEFEQDLSVPLLNTERTSRGTLCQRQPNLFSMDFADPRGDRVVADGEHFWIWFRSQNPGQVMRVPVDPARGGLDFYREFLRDPLAKYHLTGEGTEPVDGTPTHRILLEPRMERGYESATVWIDPASNLIRRVEIRESNGSVRRITLSDVRLDPDVSAAIFTFVVPEGVQVVSAGGRSPAPVPRP